MDRRLVSRLLAPVGVVSVLLLVTAILSAWYLRSIQHRLAWSLTENVASVVAAQELESGIREVDAALDRYLITGERVYLESIPRLHRQTADALRSAEEWALSADERALMAQVRRGYDRLFAEFERAMRESGPDLRPRVAALAAIPEREILEPAREYRRLNESALTRTGLETARLADRLTIGLLTLGLCGAAGGLLGGWVLTTGVRRAVERTEARLRGTAARLSTVVPPGDPGRDPAEWVDASVAAVLDRLHATERAALRAEQLAWVGQMAAGVAHEIRNPLAAIKILVQAAADPLRETPFRSRDLSVIEGEITRLERIVSGFLDFARPPRPDKQPVELRAVVEDAAAALRARAEVQRVAVEVAPPAEPVALSADPHQLRQVVYNLLYNALDAQPKGGRVTISWNTEPGPPAAGFNTGDRPPGWVELRVEDEGGGLPSGLGERVFDPFVSTKPTGLGLGLSICRRVVESHGGSIRAAGRPGGGAVFTVTLPSTPA